MKDFNRLPQEAVYIREYKQAVELMKILSDEGYIKYSQPSYYDVEKWRLVRLITWSRKVTKGSSTTNRPQGNSLSKTNKGEYMDNINTIDIYVDGSFDKETNIFSWGVVLVDIQTNNREEFTGCARNPDSRYMNVAGEIYGSVLACKLACKRKYKNLNLYYDYTGIKEWAEGNWRRNNPLTKRYYEYIQSLNGKLTINYIKVKAHTGSQYNELADTLAKKAIIECQLPTTLKG